MKVYLVGGAVRDKLLRLPVKEHDWVVVGASPEEMLQKGFKPVGKDFPVFLHPKTHEEYALARTERKTAKGYKGFKFYAAPDVTLEQDLKRRDLTINAIAQTSTGKLIDPLNGRQDLKNKILRHVSPAFAEDPVRILRIARFSSRFTDFTIHPSTMLLMKQMVVNGEVNALVPERVWQELNRSLSLAEPQRFFEVLKQCAALKPLFPEFANNYNATIASLSIATYKSKNPKIRFAAFISDLAPQEIKDFSKKNRIPKDYQELALLTANYYPVFNDALKLTAKHLLELFEKTDAFRRRKRFQEFMQTCAAKKQDCCSKQKKLLKSALQAANNVNAKKIDTKNLTGIEINQQLRTLRIDAIQHSLCE